MYLSFNARLIRSLAAFISWWVFYTLFDAQSSSIDIEDLKQRFGKRLQYLRKQRKLTQAQLAEEMDCSIEFVSFMERGINAPSFPNLEKLARVFGIEVYELFLFETCDRS